MAGPIRHRENRRNQNEEQPGGQESKRHGHNQQDEKQPDQKPSKHYRHKRRQQQQQQGDDQPLSLTKIKQKIRGLKRLLDHGPRTAQIKVESERKLIALELELGERLIDKREREMAVKYRRVKHFERKKAERKVKQAKKALEEAKTDEEKEECKRKLEECELDLLYTRHYPKTMRYVSLYPKENADDPKNIRRKQEIRQKLREALENGGDFEAFAKAYRQSYREKLIRLGKIPAPRTMLVDEERNGHGKQQQQQSEDTDEKQEEEEEENKGGKTNGLGDDDFFA